MLSILTVNNKIERYIKQQYVDSTEHTSMQFPELSGSLLSYRPHHLNWFFQQSQILSNNLSCDIKINVFFKVNKAIIQQKMTL